MTREELLEKRKGLAEALMALAQLDEPTEEQLQEHEAKGKEIDSIDAKLKRMDEAQAKLDAGDVLASANEPKPKRPALKPDPAAIIPSGHRQEGASEEDRKNYSQARIGKMLRAIHTGEELTGVEKELHQQAQSEAKEFGAVIGNGELALPQGYMTTRLEVKGMDKTINANRGDDFVPENFEAGSLIGLLKDRLVLTQLGASFRTYAGGGDISIPKLVNIGDKTTTKAETAVADSVDLGTNLVKLAPNRLPVTFRMTEQLILQSEVELEAEAREHLLYTLQSTIEQLALFGDGTGTNPLGILNVTGVQDGNLAAAGIPNRKAFRKMRTKVEDANIPFTNFGFLTGTALRDEMQETPIDPSSNAQMIWNPETPNRFIGENAQTSNFISVDGSNNTTVISGSWDNLLIRQWGGVSMRAGQNPVDNDGLVHYHATTFFDTAVKHPQAFVIADNFQVS